MGNPRRIDPETAAEIRRRYAANVTYDTLAVEYGVSNQTMKDIINCDRAYRNDRQRVVGADHAA